MDGDGCSIYAVLGAIFILMFIAIALVVLSSDGAVIESFKSVLLI